MKQKTTFTGAGWNFIDTWSILNGKTYPYLNNTTYLASNGSYTFNHTLSPDIPNPDKTENDDNNSSSNMNLAIFGIIVVAILLIIIAVIILVFIKRSMKKEESPNKEVVDDESLVKKPK